MVEDQQEVQDVEDVVSDSPAESVEVESQEAETETPEQKVTFTEEQQAAFNQRLGEKTSKHMQNERKLEAQLKDEQQRIADLQSQIPQPTMPDVPQMPNSDGIYDDPEKFQQDMVNWKAATEQSAEYNAHLVVQERQQAADAQRQANDQAVEFKRIEDNYSKNAESFGIDESKLQQDVQTTFNSGVARDMIVHIAQDAQGPLLMDYLVKNPLELDTFRNLPPFQQVAYLESTVRPKLTGTRKATKAPKPAEVLGGAGVPEKVNQLIKDAVFSN